MKKIISLILAMMLIVCGSMAAFAEDTASDQTPQAGSEAPSGTPPEMPEGRMPGGPGTGTPPEKPDGQPGGPGL